MKRNIILMGPPGAGKGTLAKQLKEALNLVHISTGDMFRDAIKAETKLGLLAANYINRGDLVPDEVTIGLVKERLSQEDCANGFLLDGFPRTLVQAEALQEIAREVSRNIDVVINLECDDNELIRRISGRRVCRKCGAPYHVETMKPKVEGVCDLCGGELYQRKDDNEEALKVRLTHYNSETKPLLDYYSKLDLLKSFNSLVGKEQLFDEVCKYLQK